MPIYISFNLVERIKGLEPSQSAWKADMLTIKHHIRISLIEPQDFHLWEQRLGSCLQPLPAVFPHLATNIQSFYIAISYFHAFKRFSFRSKPIGLEPKPSNPIMSQNAIHLHQTSNPCYHKIHCCTDSIELACTLAAHFNMALYSLLDF